MTVVCFGALIVSMPLISAKAILRHLHSRAEASREVDPPSSGDRASVAGNPSGTGE